MFANYLALQAASLCDAQYIEGVCILKNREILVNTFPLSDLRTDLLCKTVSDAIPKLSIGGAPATKLAFGFGEQHLFVVCKDDIVAIVIHECQERILVIESSIHKLIGCSRSWSDQLFDTPPESGDENLAKPKKERIKQATTTGQKVIINPTKRISIPVPDNTTPFPAPVSDPAQLGIIFPVIPKKITPTFPSPKAQNPSPAVAPPSDSEHCPAPGDSASSLPVASSSPTFRETATTTESLVPVQIIHNLLSKVFGDAQSTRMIKREKKNLGIADDSLSKERLADFWTRVSLKISDRVKRLHLDVEFRETVDRLAT